MPPLGLLVIGMVVVGVDLSYNGFDFIPDVVGWPLVLLGLGSLARRSPWFSLALGSAALGLVLAVLQLVGATGSLIGLLDVVSGTGIVFGTCSGIIALVAEPEVQRTADLIRWWDVVLVVVASAAVVVLGEGLGLLALVLVGLVLTVVVCFLVFCWKQRHRPELAPTP